MVDPYNIVRPLQEEAQLIYKLLWLVLSCQRLRPSFFNKQMGAAKNRTNWHQFYITDRHLSLLHRIPGNRRLVRR